MLCTLYFLGIETFFLEGRREDHESQGDKDTDKEQEAQRAVRLRRVMQEIKDAGKQEASTWGCPWAGSSRDAAFVTHHACSDEQVS